MINQNGSSFTLKLIDWERLKKMKKIDSTSNNISSLFELFFRILFGNHYWFYLKFYKFFEQSPNTNTILKINFRKKLLSAFKQAKIYSKRTAVLLTKLMIDMYYENTNNQSTEETSDNPSNPLNMETIMLRLEEVLVDDPKENNKNHSHHDS
jgi:hypothetical protein